MKRTPTLATPKSRFLNLKLLLLLLVSVSVPASIASVGVVAAFDSPQARISEVDVEELSLRLSQLAVMQVSNTGSVANVDAGGENLPTEVHYLMLKYGLDAAEAVAQLEVQAAASIASEWLAEELSDEARLGGMWIDHSRGGGLVVAITDAELGREIVAATSGLITIRDQSGVSNPK